MKFHGSVTVTGPRMTVPSFLSAKKALGALLPLIAGNDAQSTRGSPGDSDSYACEPSTLGFRLSGNHMGILIKRGATVAVYDDDWSAWRQRGRRFDCSDMCPAPAPVRKRGSLAV